MKYKGSNKFSGCFRAKDILPLQACVWLLLLLLASCGEAVEVAQPELPVGTPVRVTADLQVSFLPFTSLTEGAATRADIDKTAAEKEIKTAYVVQFDGTAAASKAVWVSGDVSALLKVGSPVNVNFTLTAGVKKRVYVAVNPASVPTVGMTLPAFETVAYTVATTLPATGLPMTASQDVAAGETFALFQLKSVLAKLTFKTSLGTLTLKGIPSAYSLYAPAPGASAVRPSGVTYTATATLTSGTAYYVPANLSGQVQLSDKMLRCSTFAPANSMYVVVNANNTTYNYYLGEGTPGDFNVVGNYAYTVNATVTGTNVLDMRIGTPPAITALDGSGTANCYIATTGNAWYSFNGKVMGNGKTTPAHTAGVISGDINSPAITPTPLNPVSTDVLWETWNTTETPVKGSVVGGAYLANGRVLFLAGTTEGNAVVAARDAENNILWSWHIWRTNAMPAAQTLATLTATEGTFDATGTTTLSGLQIMDRNLGALSATGDYVNKPDETNLSIGLLYQFGRKDPIPGGADLAVGTTTMATIPSGLPVIPGSSKQYTIEESIQQPTTFFMFDGDWCSVRTDNLWGTPLTNTVKIASGTYDSNKGTKSIYDPCPVGWCVGPGYVFANATKPSGANLGTDKGYSLTILTSGSSWFPASGYRLCSDGVLRIVGSEGLYWIPTPSVYIPRNASFLDFNSDNVNPILSGRRGGGTTVRCVKE